MRTNTNLGRWLAAVSDTYASGIRVTAYEIAAALSRGRHPTDDELVRATEMSRRSMIEHRQILRRDGFLTWRQGVGRGNGNVYALRLPEKVCRSAVQRKVRI